MRTSINGLRCANAGFVGHAGWHTGLPLYLGNRPPDGEWTAHDCHTGATADDVTIDLPRWHGNHGKGSGRLDCTYLLAPDKKRLHEIDDP